MKSFSSLTVPAVRSEKGIPASGSVSSIVMRDRSEVIKYQDPGIPLYIKTESLSFYADMRSLPHWHEDLEIIYIISGQLWYHVNDKALLLRTNDCVLVNSRQIHFSTSDRNRECTFTCILFHPSLFAGNQKLFEKTLVPIIRDSSFSYHLLSQHKGLHPLLVRLVHEFIFLQKERSNGYELRIMSMLYDLLWQVSCREEETGGIDDRFRKAGSHRDLNEIQAQRDMVAFIRQNYNHHITLAQIADSGKVCRSKCCTLFQKYINSTPIQYLSDYRLEISRTLLEETNLSITEIAGECGFGQSSYFTRIFKRKYKMTPRQYRSRQISAIQRRTKMVPDPMMV